ncbi:MAG TPA: hypothetical protein VGJ77_02225 [Gaiellaceae bacterium]|jgi:uncharacterized protein YukE
MPGPVWLPEVVGDPAGMRALASTLRGHAATVAWIESNCTGTVTSMTFEGPAATRFRARAEDCAKSLTSAGDELLQLAGTLDRAASDVEAAQAERARKLAEMAREAEQARA